MSAEELRTRGWHTENPTFNSKHMFFYYRLLADGRFLLGGRANHIGDPEGAEQTYAGLKRSIADFNFCSRSVRTRLALAPISFFSSTSKSKPVIALNLSFIAHSLQGTFP